MSESFVEKLVRESLCGRVVVVSSGRVICLLSCGINFPALSAQFFKFLPKFGTISVIQLGTRLCSLLFSILRDVVLDYRVNSVPVYLSY